MQYISAHVRNLNEIKKYLILKEFFSFLILLRLRILISLSETKLKIENLALVFVCYFFLYSGFVNLF
jgi:hypothetical protein